MPTKSATTRRVAAVIAYDGDALRGGEMDIRDLAPALLGFGDLVRDANRRLNGDRAEIAVRVKSRFKRGSFGITISLIQTITQHARSLFDGATFYDAITIAKFLGLVIYSERPKEVVENIFELLKFLNGDDPESREEVGDGTIRITNKRGATKIVNNGTLILIEDNSVRNDVRRVLGPLRSDGVEKFQTRDGTSPIETITRDDLPALAPPPMKRELPAVASENPVLETRSVEFFQIVSPVFRENNKWKLNAGHGDFWAEIADPMFLSKVHRHEILFGEGDLLKAEYVTTSLRQGSKIEAETKILRVLEKISPVDGSSQTTFLT